MLNARVVQGTFEEACLNAAQYAHNTMHKYPLAMSKLEAYMMKHALVTPELIEARDLFNQTYLKQFTV
jgi:hypothetical protein